MRPYKPDNIAISAFIIAFVFLWISATLAYYELVPFSVAAAITAVFFFIASMG
jgi:hypothetical protein